MGKFVISTRKDGEFQFNLLADNGQIILSSEGYKTKQSCMNGVESVRKNAAAERFETKTAKNGKFHFVVKATNGQVVGSSQLYEAEAGMNNGIKSVMKNAPDATIDDQTL
ncbi:MAG: YegP family protein [Lentimicrobiaceae bacterium]|nr:YegP family protein [Lentimicrobiaceae bacterium]